MADIEVILHDLVEELYFRAQQSLSKEERKAIKGVQHSIERVIEKHGLKPYKREKPRVKQVITRNHGPDDPEHGAQTISYIPVEN